MKTIKRLFFALALVLGITSCSSSWLDTELNGSSLSQEEYDKLTDATASSVRGLYSLMYQNSGDRHDYFGQKSIDMATDIISGDMAMTNNSYGWFTDAGTWNFYSSTSGRNSYFWSFYYTMIMNANSAIKSLSQKEELSETEMDAYAQALSMRAYCYFNLLNLYKPSRYDDAADKYDGNTGMAYSTVPVYTELSYDSESGLIKEQPLSSAQEIYDLIVADLNTAITYFETSAQARQSKLFVDVNVARGLLAYTYLQSEQFDSAYATAKKVIDGGEFSLLSLDDITTTGFSSVSENSWMWGLDVTTENTGGLATFWGHMDVFTYSYAFSGATKGMDEVLYGSIPESDSRKAWFDESRKFIPTGKFYDAARGATSDAIDRNWLNDIVYMRIEEMYLIAAEAAFEAGKTAEATDMLATLLDQRDATAAAAVRANTADLKSQLYYNWRVEMWGEGKGLMTFKRFGEEKQLGSTQYDTNMKKGRLSPISSNRDAKGYTILMMVPFSEETYNPNIGGVESSSDED